MNYRQYFLGTTTFCTLDGQRRSLLEIYSQRKTTRPPEVLAEDEDGKIVVVGLVGISRPSTSDLPKRILKNPGYFRILFKQGTFIDLLLSNRLVLKNSKKAVHPDKLKTNKRISALYQQYRHSNGTHESPDYVSLIKPPKSRFIDRSTMPRHMFSYAFYSTSRCFQHYRKTNQRGIHADQQQQIHHKDYDSVNDSGSNLEILTKPDHNALHCRDHQDKPSQKTTKLLLTFMILGIIPTKDRWDRAVCFIKKFGWESVSDFPDWKDFKKLAKDRVRLLHALRKLLKKYYKAPDPSQADDATYFYPLELKDFGLKSDDIEYPQVIKSLSLLNTIFDHNRHLSYTAKTHLQRHGKESKSGSCVKLGLL